MTATLESPAKQGKPSNLRPGWHRATVRRAWYETHLRGGVNDRNLHVSFVMLRMELDVAGETVTEGAIVANLERKHPGASPEFVVPKSATILYWAMGFRLHKPEDVFGDGDLISTKLPAAHELAGRPVAVRLKDYCGDGTSVDHWGIAEYMPPEYLSPRSSKEGATQSA